MDNRPDRSRMELKVAGWLLPWAAFLAMLAWARRVKNMFSDVPAYGDTREV